MMTKEQLIAFENRIIDLFHAGKIPYPLHFSGCGNEDWLINYFSSKVSEKDWVFSTWRSHYQALLKGIPEDKVEAKILNGESMHLMDKNSNFFCSSIVGGICPIAVGTALAIKRAGKNRHVHCFIGDGAMDEGVCWTSIRYSSFHDLPITFIIEDNGLSVDTGTSERCGDLRDADRYKCVIRYNYNRKWPHCQTGQIVEAYSQGNKIEMRYM